MADFADLVNVLVAIAPNGLISRTKLSAVPRLRSNRSCNHIAVLTEHRWYLSRASGESSAKSLQGVAGQLLLALLKRRLNPLLSVARRWCECARRCDRVAMCCQ